MGRRIEFAASSWIVRQAPGVFLALLILAALSGCLAAPAAAAKKSILLLESMPIEILRESSRWFGIQLEELGYEIGGDLDLRILNANGDRRKAEELLEEALEKHRPDLVVTNATLAGQMAKERLRGSGIPQVFMNVAHPVAAGRRLEGSVDYWWEPSGPEAEQEKYAAVLRENSAALEQGIVVPLDLLQLAGENVYRSEQP